MDQNERDMLIRLQQDLKNSIQNHNQIMTDLKDIFQRIEKESKTVIAISGDVKYLKERFEILEKDLKETTESIEEACDKVTEKINKEREERKKEINDELQDRKGGCDKVLEKINNEREERIKEIAKETQSRKTLDTEIRTSVRAAKLLATILGGIGLLLGAAAAVIQIMQWLKDKI